MVQICRRFFLGYYLVVWLMAPLHAQAPAIQNADLNERPATSGLKATIETLAGQSTDPIWIGYSVPMVPGDSQMCCSHGSGDSGCCMGCRLEESGKDFQRTSRPQRVQLEPSRTLLVMVRAEAGRLDKLRALSSDCPLDAGGRRVYWLNGVDARQSVDYLAGLVRSSDWLEQQENRGKQEKRIADESLTAIAHHAESAADAVLADFLAPERPRAAPQANRVLDGHCPRRQWLSSRSQGGAE